MRTDTDVGSASAQTIGDEIAFAPGQYSPEDAPGRLLLAHELTHVVQQRRGRSIAPTSAIAAEGEASKTVERAAVGDQIDVRSARPCSPARSDESKQSTWDRAMGFVASKEASAKRFVAERVDVVSLLKSRVMSGLGLTGPGQSVASAALTGFGIELIDQLWTQRKGADFLRRAARMSGDDVAEFYKGYVTGLVEGAVSPVTDLFGLAVLAEHVQKMGLDLVSGVISGGAKLGASASAVLADLREAKAHAAGVLANVVNDPRGALVAVLTAQEGMNAFALKKATEVGKAGAGALVAQLSEPFEAKEGQPKESAEGPPAGLATAISEKAAQLEAAWLRSPWAKIGSKIGYTISFVAVQVAMFVFSSGLGNLVQRLAAEVGKVAASLGKVVKSLGTVVGKVGELVGAAGRAAAVVEEVVATVFGTLLKPLEKVLGPVLRPLERATTSLRNFLKELLGMAENAGSRIAGRTASTAGGAVAHDAKSAADLAKPASRSEGAVAGHAKAHAPASTPEHKAISTPQVHSAPSEASAPPKTPEQATVPHGPRTPAESPPASTPPQPNPPIGDGAPRRTASAEGTGENFAYNYHDVPEPSVAIAPQAGRTRPVPREPEPVPTAGPERPRMELDDETRQSLSGSGERHSQSASDTDIAPGMHETFSPDRFSAKMTEEDLVLIAQEKFPAYEFRPETIDNISMRGGRVVRRGAKNSTRPDLYLPGRTINGKKLPPVSLEAKNYHVLDPEQYEDFMLRTTDQAMRRQLQVKTVQQHIIVDLRGQDVTQEFADGLRRELSGRSKGILRFDRIHFMSDRVK